MHKTLYLLFVTAFAAALNLSARKVPAPVALDRALHSTELSAGLKACPDSPSSYTLAYSSPTGTYHIYARQSGGYIVVSGDDEIYPVLADVPAGTFSETELAPAARWILGVYDTEIQHFADTGSADESLADCYNRWQEIPALMTTLWNQSYPYNIYCPVDGGKTCVTGCVATAMAQVVRCIGYCQGSGYRAAAGVNSKGEKVEFNYADYTFDFASMFNQFSVQVSSEAIDQVGKLMLACGLSVGMGYGTSGSSAHSDNVPLGLIKHFGYDARYTRLYEAEDFSRTQWERMLYRQLELGRPVYYSGADGSMAHAFVIDGYRPAGLYHVNWGWGGMSDGYFRLTALNPMQQGIGGGIGIGYNLSQDMVYAVPPGANPGIVYGEMGGGINMVSDGVYSLYYKNRGDAMTNVSLGAVIIDSLGVKVAETTFWQGQNISVGMALRHDSYPYDFAQFELPEGRYRIYPAYRSEGADYTLVDPVNDRTHYVELTVTQEGKYTVSNIPLELKVPDVHSVGIEPGYEWYEGFSGEVGFYAVNNGTGDYTGTFTLLLLGPDGAEYAVSESQKVTVVAGMNTVVYMPTPVFDLDNKLIPAGTYSVFFIDEDGRLLDTEPYTVTITKGMPASQWESDENIAVTNCSALPDKLLSWVIWPHVPMIETLQTHRNMSLLLAFYPPSELAPAYKFTCFQGTIEPQQSLFPFDPLTVDVPFGRYEVCYRKGYGQISPKRPIRIGESVDGIAYYPAAGEGASAALTEESKGLREVVVPEFVTVGNVRRTVTALEPEALMQAHSLEVVDLPAGLADMGVNALLGCSSLRQILLRAEVPPFKWLNFIAPGLKSGTAFYVPASAYDAYREVVGDRCPVYVLVDHIGSAEAVVTGPSEQVVLPVLPIHKAVDSNFVIEPADEQSAAVAEVKILSVETGSIRLEVNPRQVGTATFHVRPAHCSSDFATLTVTVPEMTGVADAASPDQVPTPKEYDLSGRRIQGNEGAKLPFPQVVISKDGIRLKRN